MSWDAYVTSLETGKGKCKYAALVGKQGGVWAESKDKADFNISQSEVNQLAATLVNQDKDVLKTGLDTCGVKFTCLYMEPDILAAQGKGANKDFSLVVAVTHQAVIIGMNPDSGVKINAVRDAVESMKNYLNDQEY